MRARAEPPSVHALGLAAVGAALLLAARVLPLDAPPLSLFACPLKAATGWPCLFCGSTHAFAHFVRGEFAQAALASPLGALLALACALHAAITLLRLAGAPVPLPTAPSPRALQLGAIALLAASWMFVAARARGAL
jgi:hypothetical protein